MMRAGAMTSYDAELTLQTAITATTMMQPHIAEQAAIARMVTLDHTSSLISNPSAATDRRLETLPRPAHLTWARISPRHVSLPYYDPRDTKDSSSRTRC